MPVFFFFSEKITEEIRLREPSKARMRQVLQLGLPELQMDELRRVLASGAAVLVYSVVFGRLKSGAQIGFLGEEDAVLEKIRAIPLPKEGKKGTSRTVLVKMVTSMCRKMAAPAGSYKSSLRDKVAPESLLALRRTILSARGLPGSQERTAFDSWDYDKRRAAKKAVAAIGGKEPETNVLLSIACVLGRDDVDEQIVEDGYKAWIVEDTMGR